MSDARALITKANRSAEKAQQIADKGPDRWTEVCKHLADVRRVLVDLGGVLASEGEG